MFQLTNIITVTHYDERNNSRHDLVWIKLGMTHTAGLAVCVIPSLIQTKSRLELLRQYQHLLVCIQTSLAFYFYLSHPPLPPAAVGCAL